MDSLRVSYWICFSLLGLITATFTTVGLYFLLLRCFSRRRVDPTQVASSPEDPIPEKTRGVDPTVIESFTKITYSAAHGKKLCRGDGMSVCVICVSVFKDGETLRFTPTCRHVFHSDCIDTWLKSHDTCPFCRASVVSGSGLLKMFSARFVRLV